MNGAACQPVTSTIRCTCWEASTQTVAASRLLTAPLLAALPGMKFTVLTVGAGPAADAHGHIVTQPVAVAPTTVTLSMAALATPPAGTPPRPGSVSVVITPAASGVVVSTPASSSEVPISPGRVSSRRSGSAPVTVLVQSLGPIEVTPAGAFAAPIQWGQSLERGRFSRLLAPGKWWLRGRLFDGPDGWKLPFGILLWHLIYGAFLGLLYNPTEAEA